MPQEFPFQTTADICIPEKAIDHVIGQDHAVHVMKKAALQRRHVLLIGEPGTGKSLLGMALAELLPKEHLIDVLAVSNTHDIHHPFIKTIPAGKGRSILHKTLQRGGFLTQRNFFLVLLSLFGILFPFFSFYYFGTLYGYTVGAILFSVLLLTAIVLTGFFYFGTKTAAAQEQGKQKLLVDNSDQKQLPFYDGTGAHAGALLGDILHDPYQSGGLGTPAHERVVAGLIHKAHQGVLFIDEIGTLQLSTQQDLLTALQEGRFAITGQSAFSAGAMVRTDPVPCQFILIAAGNMDNIKEMHPALRSRMRGYGYEVYMNETMPDTSENCMKLARFIAQEIVKDGKIPHFTKEAVQEIIKEARRRANKKGHLTLKLRDLGGLIRAAGDIAVAESIPFVEKKHVLAAHDISRTLEHQIADKLIEERKSYDIIMTTGKQKGRVNSLAVIGSGDDFSGIVLPIETQAIPAKDHSRIVVSGDVDAHIREATKNSLAVLEKLFGTKQAYTFYVQFLTTHKIEGHDTVSLAVATALASTIKKRSVRQNVAITGAISVQGDALRVDNIAEKIHAAIEAGFKKVLVPKGNLDDIRMDKELLQKIKIVPVDNITDVLKEALVMKFL